MVHLLRHIAGSNFVAELAGFGHGDRELDGPIAKHGLIVRCSGANPKLPWPQAAAEPGSAWTGEGARPHTRISLLVAQTLDRVQSRRADGRYHSTQDADYAKNPRRHGKAADVDMQMDVARLQILTKGTHERQRAHTPRDQIRDSDPRHSSGKGDGQRFCEKLKK